MKRQSGIKIISKVLVITAGFGGLVGYAMGLHEFVPQLRARANSPDGELTVEVYQKRLFPRPIFPRMGAVAKIYDRRGTLVYEKLIYGDDDFDDTVGSSYNKISFEGDEIRIGPDPYQPAKNFVVKKSELQR